jgi:hypothetical protein
MINTETIQNELSRTVKMAVDSGEAPTVEEAYAMFAGYRLRVSVGPDVAYSPTLQAMLLTVVNTARRCFLGGVEVAGGRDADLLVRWNNCKTRNEAVLDLGGKLVDPASTEIPEIVIGEVAPSTMSEFCVRPTFDGWIGGIAPAADEIRLDESREFTPSGVLAGSLAVSEAFQFVRGRNPLAGRRSIGLSLWKPNSTESWLATQENGPELELLPSRLWLIGLGHLGQAYLWTLGFLPYASPEEVAIVLQDTDAIVPANDSTSPLTNRNIVGENKTRAMAAWCESRGFKTRIIERLFADNFKIADDDPQVALCGVDNALARSLLEDVGFLRVIESGLGRGTEEYLAFQIHNFPGGKSARRIWKAAGASEGETSEAPAYADLGSRGLDQCGLTTLANRSVGASFVGTFASTLVIAEVLRMIAGGMEYDVIDGTLRQPQSIVAINKERELPPFNPGITPVLPSYSLRSVDAAQTLDEVSV